MELSKKAHKLLIPLIARLFCIRAYSEKTIKIRELECLVEVVDGKQIVAFRGSESGLVSDLGIVDWLRNLLFMPWYVRKVGWGHAGFMRGGKDLYEKGLYGLLRRELPIVLVGHSLGGALALVVARLLLKDDFKVLEVVTFGSPRVFQRGSSKRVLRAFVEQGVKVRSYYNKNDPVPCVPPEWLGYGHLRGTGVRLDSDLTGSEAHKLSNYDV